MGILDCLSAGFRLIARRWWLLLIPIALDLFLWMGPRISMDEMIKQLQDVMATSQTTLGLQDRQSQAALAQQTQQMLEQLGKDTNLLGLLSAGIPGVPSLVALRAPTAQPLNTDRPIIEAATAGQLILWSLGLLLIGSAIASVYVTWIGRAVKQEVSEGTPFPFPSHVLHTLSRLLLIGLIVALLGFVLSVPIVLFTWFALLISQGLAVILLNIMGIVLIWAAVWIVIYLYFVVDAVVIHRAGLLRAIWNSLNIVVRNLWASVGLVLLIWLLSNGLTLLWTRLESATWTTFVAIIGNAFVSASLTAASLFFYVERYRRWQANQEQVMNPLLRIWRGPKS